MTKEESIQQARQMMFEVMQDNGMINVYEPNDNTRYPEEHVNKIAQACMTFYGAHPEYLTEEHTNNICCGEYEENQRLYSHLPEYAELWTSLNNFFDGEDA